MDLKEYSASSSSGFKPFLRLTLYDMNSYYSSSSDGYGFMDLRNHFIACRLDDKQQTQDSRIQD
jgi:hypothetical protein